MDSQFDWASVKQVETLFLDDNFPLACHAERAGPWTLCRFVFAFEGSLQLLLLSRCWIVCATHPEQSLQFWRNALDVRGAHTHLRHCLQNHAAGTGLAHADGKDHGPVFHGTVDRGPGTEDDLEWFVLGIVRLL